MLESPILIGDYIYLLQYLDDIRDYFGVKIAMYFGWLGLYTKWLFAPAIFGIIMFGLMTRGEMIRDWCMFIFSIFNIVWATLYLEAWKRRSAELAYRWGTLDMPSESLKDPRVLFEVQIYRIFINKLKMVTSSLVSIFLQ